MQEPKEEFNRYIAIFFFKNQIVILKIKSSLSEVKNLVENLINTLAMLKTEYQGLKTR
jgi:hypothetical protein